MSTGSDGSECAGRSTDSPSPSCRPAQAPPRGNSGRRLSRSAQTGANRGQARPAGQSSGRRRTRRRSSPEMVPHLRGSHRWLGLHDGVRARCAKNEETSPFPDKTGFVFAGGCKCAEPVQARRGSDVGRAGCLKCVFD